MILPTAAILFSAGTILLPALHDYLTLHYAAHGAKSISASQFEIPTDHLFRTSIWMCAFRQQGTITMLNAPGHLFYLLIGLLVGHSSHWSPASLSPAIWRVISFPLCALPAWFFLGRSLDGCFLSTRLRRADLVIGLTLFTTFLVLTLGLRFGISPEERAGQDLLFFAYIYGFAMWAAFMAVPLVAWIRQRSIRSSLDVTSA